MTGHTPGQPLQAGRSCLAYAPVFSALMLLWPLLALLGTAGFAPLAGLTGLAALILARPGRPRSYAILFLAFLLWAALSELWSPSAGSLVRGSLVDGSFALGSRSVIILLTGLFSMLTLAAALRAGEGLRVSRILVAAFILHALILFGASVFSGPLLERVYGSDLQAQAKGMQNLMRNMNAFILVLPILLTLLVRRASWPGWAAAAALVLGCLLLSVRMDNQTAVLALAAMLAAMAAIAMLPNTGWRWLLGGLAAYILSAPLLVAGLIRIAPAFDTLLAPSFRSRLWAWELVLAEIRQAPLTGHGLMASRTWRDTYADHPEWLAGLPAFWSDYPVIPGHPHNMALQIWAETGLVGALLSAGAIWLLALRLPAPRQAGPVIRFAGAGMMGAGLMMFSFSYSAWSEGFWAGVSLALAALFILAGRTVRP